MTPTMKIIGQCVFLYNVGHYQHDILTSNYCTFRTQTKFVKQGTLKTLHTYVNKYLKG